MHPRDGCPDFELMANKEVWFKGATMTTNQWAMRDRPYDKQKPANTWRAAVTGASHDMGTGVGDDEVYDNVVEDRVNAESEGVRYEFLNFSVGGYGPVQRLVDIDARMFEFQLDALIYVGIDDLYWMIKDLADAAQENLPIPYDHLNDVLREEGITPGTAYAESMQKLKPRNEELLRWLYDEIVARCRQHDVVPMAAFIPHMLSLEAEPEKQAQVQRQMEIAREAGMIVLDLTHAYDGQEYRSLWIAPWDSHPNTEGHRLLAEALYKELKQVNTL
jgi:hypothetical protein